MTGTFKHDTECGAAGLPKPTAELFLEAGLIVAGGAARAAAVPRLVEEIVRRAVQHAIVLHDQS